MVFVAHIPNSPAHFILEPLRAAIKGAELPNTQWSRLAPKRNYLVFFTPRVELFKNLGENEGFNYENSSLSDLDTNEGLFDETCDKDWIHLTPD
ncbi:hypothetical protein TNCT_577801, partial [Trichonephila clavata]